MTMAGVNFQPIRVGTEIDGLEALRVTLPGRVVEATSLEPKEKKGRRQKRKSLD